MVNSHRVNHIKSVKWNTRPVGAFRKTPYHDTSLIKWFILPILVLFLLISPAIAQEDDTPPIVTSENITQLQSISTIDFADYEAEIGEVELGWFQMTEDGVYVAVIGQSEDGSSVGAWVVNSQPEFSTDFWQVFPPEPERVTDIALMRAFSTVGAVVARYEGEELILTTVDDAGGRIATYKVTGPPVEVWMDLSADTEFIPIWVEIADGDGYLLEIQAGEIAQTIPYAPAQDPEAVVRIGRIPPPFAVTSSLEGLVKLWDLQTGEVIAQADNGTGQPSVFGAINSTGTHLAWRDNLSNNLYLLNFETDENQLVAALDGSYMQFMFLTQNADVIIGVNLDFEPNVYVWDVATGERYDLGPYHTCNRVPDMARLSADGTTLVIGCDTGLDIWRIASPEN